MYCTYCNKLIDDDSLFCRYCGKEVTDNYNDNFKEDTDTDAADNGFYEEDSYNATDDTIVVKQPSMRWYNFLVKFLLPFWIFYGALDGFSQTSLVVRDYYGSWDYYMTNPMNGIPNTIALALSAFMIIFLFITWRELKKLTKNGYKYVVIYFLSIIFLPVIVMLIYLPFYLKENMDYDFFSMVTDITSKIIISIPTLIYFRKRKFLFVNDELTI